MLYFLYLCTEVYATRVDHLLVLQSHLSSLHLFSSHQFFAGSLQASCRCNLTAPCPVLLFPLPGFCFFAGLFKLSCRIEQLVAHKGGQLEHVEHLCTGSSHSSASLSLSLARAPWIRVLKGGCVLKPLSYALCSVEPTLRQFIPHFLKIKVNGEWKAEWRATRKLVTNRQKHFPIINPNLL